MNGEQQKPPTAENQKEKPCVCPKDHIHESNGCSKCCRENWPYVVSVSVLQEIPPNKRKRDKAIRMIFEFLWVLIVLVVGLFIASMMDAFDSGNSAMNLFLRCSTALFLGYGMASAIIWLLDKIIDV